jgi:hypothetical protein
MIEVQNQARVHYHHGPTQVGVVADENQIGLIFTEGPDSTVYLMSKGEAERVERGIAKARTGLHIASVVPENGDGQAA